MLAGRLTVGASATLGVYFLPELIARFHSAHPQVEVDLVVANKERVEAGLREHVFALGFAEGPYDDAILHARPIGADEIAAVSAAGHPQVGQRLSPRELAEHAVILREPGSGTRAVVENAYASIGLQIEAAMSVSDTEAIKRMLIAEHSIAYISSLSVKDELRRDDLVLLAVDGLRIERPLQKVWLKGRSLSPSAQAFFDMVLTSVAQGVAAA